MFFNMTSNDNFNQPSSTIEIQIQSGIDPWRTYSTMESNSGYISANLQEVAAMNPDCRVRAIDSNGRLIDML